MPILEAPAGSAAATDATLPARSVAQAMARGFRGLCPRCGRGRLFCAFVKVADHCSVCGEAFHHHRADDLPAYLVIMVVGHALVPLVLGLETAYAPPYWVHAAIWLPVTLILTLGLLQPVKGATVGVQWAARMHGFGGGAPDGR